MKLFSFRISAIFYNVEESFEKERMPPPLTVHSAAVDDGPDGQEAEGVGEHAEACNSQEGLEVPVGGQVAGQIRHRQFAA